MCPEDYSREPRSQYFLGLNGMYVICRSAINILSWQLTKAARHTEFCEGFCDFLDGVRRTASQAPRTSDTNTFDARGRQPVRENADGKAAGVIRPDPTCACVMSGGDAATESKVFPGKKSRFPALAA